MSDFQAAMLRIQFTEDRKAAMARLIEILGSGKAASPAIGKLVADMLDPNGPGNLRLKLQGNHPGRIRSVRASQKMRDAGFFLEEAVDGRREEYEPALAEAMERFGIGRTSAAKALQRRREESRIMDEVESETGERPDAVFAR